MGISKNKCIVLCSLGFIGLGGLHDFYLKRTGMGLLKFFTFNFFGIGTIWDLYRIITDKYYYFSTMKKIREQKKQEFIRTTSAPEDNAIILDEDDIRSADYLYLRVERVINEKIERAVNKNIITQEEANILTEDLEIEMESKDKLYWHNKKGAKTYDICLDLLENKDSYDTLLKIEKA